MSIKGKINFLQLERYGENSEQTARNQFQESFEFLPFNASLVSQHCSARTVIGFDPTYLPKSGKKTEGVGTFWSGCADAPRWGLEMCGIAAIDLDHHTTMHLEAVQTLPEADEKLLGFYAKLLTDRKEMLQKISNDSGC